MAGTSEAAGERATRQGAAAARPREDLTLVARLASWAATWPWALPVLAGVLSLVFRLWLVARTHAMIDADEAMVGIQAERILHGQFPVYFYGQAYMGSLEAYLVAPLVAVLGPTGWALRLVPIVLSLLLVYLTWRLALALLPTGAPSTPMLAGLASLVAAIPPLYDAVAEMRAWGGQIEIYVISLALLLCAVELADRLRAGAGGAEQGRRWLLIGFLAGLGIWINPLVIYALVAAFLWLLPPVSARAFPAIAERISSLVVRVPFVGSGPAFENAHGWPAATKPAAGSMRIGSMHDSASSDERQEVAAAGGPMPAGESLARRAAPAPGAVGKGVAALIPLALLVPGLAVGGLPAWLYAAQNHAQNLLVYVTQSSIDPTQSGAARHGRLFLGAAITFRYFTCVAPNVLDGRLPTETLRLLPLRLLLLLPPVAGILAGLWLLRRRSRVYIRTGLPLLFAAIITAIYCLGTSAWAETRTGGCTTDPAGRYAVPLALVAPFLLLAVLALPAALAAWRASTGASGRADARDGQGTVARIAPIVRRTGALWLLVLLGAGILQAGTYALASPSLTFQSPYYDRIPADDSQLLSYLQAHDIHAAWCNHWLGNVVTYRTDGATTCADYYDQVYLHGIQRPPGTLQTVSAADRPSFILILTDSHPCLARELDAQGVAYTLAVLPASGVTIITPDRTVNPATVVQGLGQDYTEQSVQDSACSNAAISSVPTSTLSSSSNSRAWPGRMNSRRPF
jgi:hypothetical protein